MNEDINLDKKVLEGKQPQEIISDGLLLLGELLEGDDLTETEVRERFRIMNYYYQWYKVGLSQEGFPDMLLVNNEKKVVKAEVEVKSSNFKAHKHDMNKCDLIICWKHTWRKCPIEILEIKNLWEAFLRTGKKQERETGK